MPCTVGLLGREQSLAIYVCVSNVDLYTLCPNEMWNPIERRQ